MRSLPSHLSRRALLAGAPLALLVTYWLIVDVSGKNLRDLEKTFGTKPV